MRRLVVGSYPPVPGQAAAATVAAVRRAWAEGREVVVVSPRLSAATCTARFAGREAGRVIERLGREHGCREVAVCLEAGMPFPGRGGAVAATLRARWTARRLALALSRFEWAEVVITGDLVVPQAVLGLLWPAASVVVAGSEEVAALLRASGAKDVRVVEPFAGAGLRHPVADTAAPVGPFEPGELLFRRRVRHFGGALGRRLFGRRWPAVRSSPARLARALRVLKIPEPRA